MVNEVQPKKKLVIFIDNSNLFKGLEGFRKNFRIDFLKLINHIKDMKNDRMLVAQNIYVSIIKSKDNKERKELGFFNKLRRMGFNVVVVGGKIYDDKFFEKGLDTALTMDMLEMALKGVYDVAALIAGDGDYTNLVKKVRGEGKEVEVYFFNNYTSGKLIQEANDFYPLDNVLENFELIKEKRNESAEQ